MTNHIRTPNNFPISHRRPQMGDIVTFALRQTDTSQTPLTGVAMLDDTIFLGWVNRGQEKDMLERRLEHKTETVTGRVTRVEDFEWNKAGGRCSRGDISIL